MSIYKISITKLVSKIISYQKTVLRTIKDKV